MLDIYIDCLLFTDFNSRTIADVRQQLLSRGVPQVKLNLIIAKKDCILFPMILRCNSCGMNLTGPNQKRARRFKVDNYRLKLNLTDYYYYYLLNDY